MYVKMNKTYLFHNFLKFLYKNDESKYHMYLINEKNA